MMKKWDNPSRNISLSLPSFVSHQIEDDADDDDGESQSVSEAGDIGDRALHSRKHSETHSIRLSFESFEHTSENGVVTSIPGDHSRMQPCQYHKKPLTPQLNKSPLSISGFLCSEDGEEFYSTPCAPVKEVIKFNSFWFLLFLEGGC